MPRTVLGAWFWDAGTSGRIYAEVGKGGSGAEHNQIPIHVVWIQGDGDGTRSVCDFPFWTV